MRTPRTYDADDDFWRVAFFDLAAMQKLEVLCPRCRGPLLVVNTKALMATHDRNVGVYCFSKTPLCYISMLSPRAGVDVPN